MTTVREFIKQYSDDEKAQIVQDYEKFESQGFIDDCLLRTTAEKCIKDVFHGSESTSIVLVMDRIAFECYRYFAKLI